MKNLTKILILCTIFMFSYGSFAFAAEALNKVVENKDVNIIIDSKSVKFDDVAITKNNWTLLPLRAILTNLGVQNDNEHIAWNSKEKSVTIYKDNIKLYLKVNDQTAYINGKAVALDIAPVVYKNKTYIPTRFVSQSLGNKIVWDKDTKSIIITDENEFKQVKEILENSMSKMKMTKGYIMKYILNDSNSYAGESYTIELKINTDKKIFYGKQQYDGDDTNQEIICTNEKTYQKTSDETQWTIEELDKTSKEDYLKFFNVENFVSVINDSFIAGMKKIKDDDESQEIVLSGKAYPVTIPSKAEMLSLLYENKAEDFMTTITIDKKTGFIKKVLFEIYLNNVQSGTSESISSTSEFSFPEEEIEIKLPEVKDSTN